MIQVIIHHFNLINDFLGKKLENYFDLAIFFEIYEVYYEKNINQFNINFKSIKLTG